MTNILALAPIDDLAARWLPLLVDATIKGTAILALAGGALLALRRASAAARQLVLLLALASLLIAPAVSAALPGWRVLPGWAKLDGPAAPAPRVSFSARGDYTISEPRADSKARGHSAISGPPQEVLPQVTDPAQPLDATPAPVGPTPSEPIAPPAASQTPARAAHPALAWAMLVWAGGIVVFLLPLALGWASVWRLGRRSQRITDGPIFALAKQAKAQLGLRRRVALLVSDRRPIPMMWGILRPTLLLPRDAVRGSPAEAVAQPGSPGSGWSADRLWVVLLHELGHIKRWDMLTKLLAHLAAAAYWFNPLVWLAFRRFGAEAERACDDLVLAAGSNPGEYAEHILDIASGLRTELFAAHGSIAMARPDRLEGRLLAILDPNRNRRRLSVLAVLLAVAVVASVVIPLSCLRAKEPAAPFKDATITLQVDLKSGKYVPSSQPAAVVRVTDKKQLEELLAFFPDMDGKPWASRSAGWMAGAIIELTKADGGKVTIHVSENDDQKVYSSSAGRGDKEVRGDLKAFLLKLQEQQRPAPPGPGERGRTATQPEAEVPPALKALHERVEAGLSSPTWRQANHDGVRSQLDEFSQTWLVTRPTGDVPAESIAEVYTGKYFDDDRPRLRLAVSADEHGRFIVAIEGHAPVPAIADGNAMRFLTGDVVYAGSVPDKNVVKLEQLSLARGADGQYECSGRALRREPAPPATPPEALREAREEALARADQVLRQGLAELARQFPQLAVANNQPLDETLKRRGGEPGRLSLFLGRGNKPSKAPWKPEEIPDDRSWSLLAVLQPASGKETAMTMFPLYPRLGLEGQCHAMAGEAKLDAALKKLLDEALAPLKALDQQQVQTASDAPPATQPEAEWGRPVEGLQLRLSPTKRVWGADEVPAVTFEARTSGPQAWSMPTQHGGLKVNLDGEWYVCRSPDSDRIWAIVRPDRPSTPETISLTILEHAATGRPLGRLAPGRHVLWTECDAGRLGDGLIPIKGAKPVRAVSNPAVIEVAAPAPPATQPEVDRAPFVGMWLNQRRDMPGPEEATHYLMQLRADGTWVNVSIWGETARPIKLVITASGPKWDVVRKDQQSILWSKGEHPQGEFGLRLWLDAKSHLGGDEVALHAESIVFYDFDSLLMKAEYRKVEPALERQFQAAIQEAAARPPVREPAPESRPATQAEAGAPGTVTRVLPSAIDDRTAPAVEQMLREKGLNVRIVNDSAKGQATVTGTPEAVRVVGQLIAPVLPVPSWGELRVYPLKFARAEAVAPVLRTALAGVPDQATHTGPSRRVTVDAKTNSVILHASPETHKAVRQLIDSLDVPVPSARPAKPATRPEGKAATPERNPD